MFKKFSKDPVTGKRPNHVMSTVCAEICRNQKRETHKEPEAGERDEVQGVVEDEGG